MCRDLFGFGMISTYEARKVSNYQDEILHIDTCLVTDSDKSYETGICHTSYNDNDWIIVELYDTKEEAQVGHDKWLKIMTAKKLPKILKDESDNIFAEMCRGSGDEMVYEKGINS